MTRRLLAIAILCLLGAVFLGFVIWAFVVDPTETALTVGIFGGCFVVAWLFVFAVKTLWDYP